MNTPEQRDVLPLASDALALAHERLELMHSAGGITSWEWDLESDRMTWTSGRANLVRLGAEGSMPYAAVVGAIHPDDREPTRAAARRAVERNEQYAAEFRVPVPNGAPRWILSRGKVFHDAAGKPVRMLGINMDITDRKRAESALRDSEERFRATFEHAGVGIAHVGPDGYVTLANPKLCELFGYCASELRQRQLESLLAPDQLDGSKDLQKRLDADPGAVLTAPRRYVRKDGSVLDAEVSFSVVRAEDGSTKYVICIASDISPSRLVAEEMQRAVAAADAANLAKSRFLANVSHEIRTPLTAILGFAELLRRPGLDEPKRQSYLEIIDRNGHALKTLIDDILDLSKIEAGRVDFETELVSLFGLLSELEALLGRQANAKRLELVVVRDPEVPDRILTDGMRLRQILLNIVGNAVKFTQKGRVTVTVSASRSAGGAEGRLTFVVQDTGIGVAASHQHRLFQAFTQADATMTRKFGGTGLGLVLSRHLARLFGGDLVLRESAPGIGSTFVATVNVGLEPRTPKAPPEDHQATSRPFGRPLHGSTILLVEDCVDSRNFLREVLTGAGAVVDIAVDGREAVQKAGARAYDLVIMDVQMPVLDGVEATRALRADGYVAPIVAISAHAFENERVRCLAAGYDGFIAKPVRSEALIAASAGFLRVRAPQ